MVKTCLVNECGNSARGNFRFHNLPIDPTRRKEWLDIFNKNGGLRKNAKIGDHASVCHVHFDESSYGFGVTGKRKFLNEANPSLLLGSKSKKARHSADNIEPRDDDQNLLETRPAAALSEDNSHIHNAFSNFDIGNPFEYQDVNDVQTAELPLDSEDDWMDISSDEEMTFTRKKPVVIGFRTKAGTLRKRRTLEAKDLLIKRLRMNLNRKISKIAVLERKQKESALNTDIISVIRQLLIDEENQVSHASVLMDLIRNYNLGKQARWGQETLKFCIVLQSRSPATYRFTRRHIFCLPSPKTLRAYTGKSTGEAGFNKLAEKRLLMEKNRLTSPQQLCGSLKVDEMSIAQMVKLRRNFGRVYGRVDYGGVLPNGDEAANRIVAFVFCGLQTRYKIPVAFFLVKNMTHKTQTKLAFHVIEKLEALGFRVEHLVADNARMNTKTFELMNNGELSPVMRHPNQEMDFVEGVSPVRPLFLSFDPVHIIKTVRGQLMDRNLKRNGKRISFEPIRKICQLEEKKLAKGIRKIRAKDIDPNNIQRQKVKPAMKIFDQEVIASLKLYALKRIPGFEDVSALVEFLELFHWWFAIHNISNPEEHIRKRLAEKEPFYSPKDKRLLKLLNVFIPYIEKWFNEVRKRAMALPVKTKEDRKKRKAALRETLTKETFEALKFTTISTVKLIQHLLEKKEFKFVLTRRLTSDEVERTFSAVRQLMGGNHQGDAYSATMAFERILRTGIAYASADCNVALDREKDRDYQLLVATRSTKKRAKEELKFLPSAYILILNDLLEPPVMPPPNEIEPCIVAYLAGYIIFTLTQSPQFCDHCLEELQQERSASPYLAYINLLDRGGLKYPSDEMISRMWTIYTFVNGVLPLLVNSSQITADLVCFLERWMTDCDTFKCELAPTGENNSELIRGILSKFVSPLVHNKCAVDESSLVTAVNFVPTKSKSLRLRTLTT